MVVQNAINKMKDKPDDQKKVVAGGIAITIIVILMFAWSVYFVHKTRQGASPIDFTSRQLNNLGWQGFQDVQTDLQNISDQSSDALRALREAAAADNVHTYTAPEFGQGGGEPIGFPGTE